MADRESTDKNAAGKSAGDKDRQVSQDPDVGKEANSDAQKDTTSRPKGTTEDPDRTL